MNEAERTDVIILIRAALDYIAHIEGGSLASERAFAHFSVDRDESEELRDRIADVLRHVYAGRTL